MIIAAGSVVIHDVPDNSLIAGNPAKVKKALSKEEFERYFENTSELGVPYGKRFFGNN